VKPAAVTAVPFAFVSTMVSTEVAPVPIVDGAKDLAAVGAAITVRPLDVTALVMRAVPETFAAVLL
jgi:hypothetical protein